MTKQSQMKINGPCGEVHQKTMGESRLAAHLRVAREQTEMESKAVDAALMGVSDDPLANRVERVTEEAEAPHDDASLGGAAGGGRPAAAVRARRQRARQNAAAKAATLTAATDAASKKDGVDTDGFGLHFGGGRVYLHHRKLRASTRHCFISHHHQQLTRVKHLFFYLV